MIYVEMNGRLGNQLFRYAFARWLQIKGEEKDRELILDFRNIEREARKGEMPGWEDSLRHFKVQNYRYYDKAGRPAWNELTASEKAVMGICALLEKAAGKKGPLARLSVRKRFLPWQDRHGIYQIFTGYDYPFSREGAMLQRKIVAGPCECARYPEEIREVLLKEFEPRYSVSDSCRDLLEKIQGSNSVCITVRRGNYLQYSALDVCGAAFFERAAEKMQKMTKDPVFFVFSDDITWARENIRINAPVYYESGEDPVWEKLRLMYSCRHFIISNSTFSWWAQFLGRAEDKIVIAPDHWFNGEYQPPLYEEGWTTMEA